MSETDPEVDGERLDVPRMSEEQLKQATEPRAEVLPTRVAIKKTDL